MNRILFVVLVGLVFVATLFYYGRPIATDVSEASKVCSELTGSSGAGRPSEGRLACDLAYAPYQNGPRLDSGQRENFIQIAHRIDKISTVDSLWAKAILNLAFRKPRKAVSLLEEALIKDPGNPNLLSDLSAAHIAINESTGNPAELISALTTADRALQSNPNLSPALFNLAVALGKLSLVNESLRVWKAYLATDSTSGWADEARDNVSLLSREVDNVAWQTARVQLEDLSQGEGGRKILLRQLSSRFPQHLRLYVEEDLMSGWAAAIVQHQDSAAAHHLMVARTIAKHLQLYSNDNFLSDELSLIDSGGCAKSGEKQCLASIASGHLAFRRAMELYNLDAFRESQLFFLEAEREFEISGSPFRKLAVLYVGITEFLRTDYKSSFVYLDRLRIDLNGTSYPYLRARVLSMLGLLSFVAGESSHALRYYLLSVRESQECGEVVFLAYTHFLIARTYSSLGDEREAWRHRAWALSATNKFVDPRRVYSVLVDAAEASSDGGADRIALYFQDELIAFSQRLDRRRPGLVAEALLRRSKTYSRLGHYEKSDEDLRLASVRLNEVDDHDFRYRIYADILAAEAERMGLGNSEGSVASLTKAIEYFFSKAHHAELPALYLARARHYISLKRFNLAEADLGSAIGELRASHSMPLFQASSSQIQYIQSIFDEMILLQGKWLNDSRAAFLFAERASTKSFPSALFGAESELQEPLFAGEGLSTLRLALPRGVALIRYRVLGDCLLTWVIDGSGEHFIVEGIDQGALASMVEDFRLAISSGAKNKELSISSRLFDVLLSKQLEKLANGVRTLVIIPDKILWHLPFAALRREEGASYLVENFALGFSPNAKIFVEALRRDHALSGQANENVLSIGNPRFDHVLFPSLPDLPGTSHEARQIAAFYPASTLLLEEAASKKRVVSLLPKYQVIHFAGHVVGNHRFPFRSTLVFAKVNGEGGDALGGGLLSASEVFSIPFRRSRLIVLSSCSSGGGLYTYSGSSGAYSGSSGSLMEAFLMAGVPTIIGSLWDVDDRNAAVLMADFHRIRRTGKDVASALRLAQLGCLYSKDKNLRNTSVWGAFKVYGGWRTTERNSYGSNG